MAVNADTANGQLSGPTTELPVLDDDHTGLNAPNEARSQTSEPSAKIGLRMVTTVASVIVIVFAILVGWLGYGAYQSHQARQQHNEFVQVGRQSALNLTTIDFAHAEADVQRILDGATGAFHDDFQNRSQAFIDVIQQARSKSEGTIVEAALESHEGDHAQVLVAVDVKTSVAGTPEQTPRGWRMRVTVQKSGDATRVSNVEFVP